MWNIFRQLITKKTERETALHPKYKKLIELVTHIDGKPLYQFRNLLDMPHVRYNYVSRFSTEFNMHIDAETLKESLVQCEDALNGSSPKLTKAIQILMILKEQVNSMLSLDASYRLASCVYFWQDEDLNDYDYEIGDAKIHLFKKMKFDDFFLSQPMSDFLPQMNLSVEDLHFCFESEKQRRKLLSLISKNRPLVTDVRTT